MGSDLGQFNGPEGIAVDGSNNVYVADLRERPGGKVWDGNGNYLTQWGAYGSSNAQFVSPEGAAGQGQECLCRGLKKLPGRKVSTAIGDYLTQWGSYGFRRRRRTAFQPNRHSGGP